MLLVLVLVFMCILMFVPIFLLMLVLLMILGQRLVRRLGLRHVVCPTVGRVQLSSEGWGDRGRTDAFARFPWAEREGAVVVESLGEKDWYSPDIGCV